MNWAWWDGKMPVEHYRHEHGLDTEALAEAEGLVTEATELGSESGSSPSDKEKI
jgi:hypothetical protein